jgi:tetratricopeptide (TPR) repeat protein
MGADSGGTAGEARDARRAADAAWAITAGLGVLVLLVFGQARGFAFVNMDDQAYVYENPMVRNGFTWDGVLSAFASFHAANWHPVTWLSHMLDVELFGMNPGSHHLVNIALHALNASLLFWFLRSATGATWRSAVVAALFAVHPLHVESVAWVAERKDVLSTSFLLGALIAYVAYARRPRPATYALVATLFALGLLAKPMLVTLPLALLLLDAWPLGRWAKGASPRGATRVGPAALVLEKLPLLLLSVASSAMTWMAQSSARTTVALSGLDIGARVSNAIVSYFEYLAQAIWPARLAPFYPHPYVVSGGIATWKIAGAALVLAVITAFTIRERERRPYVAFGWLWYLGTLMPVIGLVQVGLQAHADRYTYVPLIGVFVAAVWTIADAVKGRPARVVAGVAAAVSVAAYAAVAWAQVASWRDSETLHRHTLAVTERNWQAWVGLGDVLSESGRAEEALAAYDQSLRILPAYAEAWNGAGVALGRLGQHQRAIDPLERAVRLRPEYSEAWYNLGTALGNLGDHTRAAQCFRRAVAEDPLAVRAWLNLGIASVMIGDEDAVRESVERLDRLDMAAGAQLRRAISSRPGTRSR